MLSDKVERVFRGIRCPRCHSFSFEIEDRPLCIEEFPRSVAGYMVRIKCGQCGEVSQYYYGRDISEGLRYCVGKWRQDNE